MKKLLAIILITLFISCAKDGINHFDDELIDPVIHSFTGVIESVTKCAIVSTDDNIVICGGRYDTLSFFKITKSGSLIWKKNHSTGNVCSVKSLVQTDDRSIYACGATYHNYASSKADVLLVKLNSNGDVLWTKTYGGYEFDYGSSIITTKDGNLLIAGKTESFEDEVFGDIYLIKVNYNGDTIWTKNYPNPYQEVAFDLIETKNGEIIITGTDEESMEPSQLMLMKTDNSGNIIWQKNFGVAPDWKWGFSSIELVGGELVTCGQHTFNEYSQLIVLKTNKFGEQIWEKSYGKMNLSERANSIKQNNDGSFSIVGTSYNVNTTQDEIIVMQIDDSGNKKWEKRFGSSYSARGLVLLKDINDDNIIIGYGSGKIIMSVLDNKGEYK